MKIGIMQPYFIPYISYFQLINAVDKFIIYDDVNYIKAGWINRNRILVDGKVEYINVPIKKASQNKLINETEVLKDKRIISKELKKVEYNYKKALYFKDGYDLFNNIMSSDYKTISEFNTKSIKLICKFLNIDTEIILSSSLEKNNKLKGEDKIINICNVLNASEYYNPIDRTDLYSVERFKENNINLRYLKTKDIRYIQSKNDFSKKNFKSNLSILDVIMHNSKEEIQEYLSRYELI